MIAPKLDDFKDDDIKELELSNLRLARMARAFKTVHFWEEESIVKVADLRVLKMPKILHALMSFLGFEREEICEPGTNLFSWKMSRTPFLEQLRKKMQEYSPMGQKAESRRHTLTINFAEKLLQGLNQEDVDNYHPGFGRLYKWITMALTIRKHDITRRHAL